MDAVEGKGLFFFFWFEAITVQYIYVRIGIL